MDSLLPPNATPLEQALEAVAGARTEQIPVPLRTLWSAADCPAAVLPWLAWQLCVPEWDPAWPEAQQRATVAAAIWVHRHQGTVGAIRRVMANAGYGYDHLFEGDATALHDSTARHNGAITHGEVGQWATYRFRMSAALTASAGRQLRRLLASAAPARCHLIELNFVDYAPVHNGTLRHDGTYNHGVA